MNVERCSVSRQMTMTAVFVLLQLFPQLYDVIVKPLIDARDRYEVMKESDDKKVGHSFSVSVDLCLQIRR